MSALRNPFAIKDNKLVLIEDLTSDQKGLSCGCVCPACGDVFIARMGDIRVKHFAHSTKGCDEVQAYITSLYRLLKEIIESGISIYIPSVIVEYNDFYENTPLTMGNIEEKVRLLSHPGLSDRQITVRTGRSMIFESAEYAHNKQGRILALLLNKNGKQLALKVTPPDTVCKTDGKVSKYKDLPTLEMDFRDDEERIRTSSRIELGEYISSPNFPSTWAFKPIMSEAYPEILKRFSIFVAKAKQQRINKQQRIKKQQINKNIEKTFTIGHDTAAGTHTHEYENHLTKWNKTDNEPTSHNKSLSDDEKEKVGYEEIKNSFTQQHTAITDAFGTRWIHCEDCNVIKPEGKFSIYGGIDRVNLGTCTDCNRKKK